MCSVRQRPIPSGPELAGDSGILRCVGIRSNPHSSGVVSPGEKALEDLDLLRSLALALQ